MLTDIGSDTQPIVPAKPIGSPAAHSLITTPDYYAPPRQNYTADVVTSNVISNGHSPSNGNVRESKTIHKTEVLHVDTNSEPIP